MKRGTFKQKSYYEIIAKKREATRRAVAKKKERVKKVPTKTQKTAQKPKSGSGKGKTVTTAKLKKELDRVFSLYIRQKYNKSCYTCGRTGTLQCGHFISRQHLATRWDENNCRPQCVGCNIYGNGKPLDFEERLKKDLGEQFVEKMKLSRHQVLKLDGQWYEGQIAYYKSFLT